MEIIPARSSAKRLAILLVVGACLSLLVYYAPAFFIEKDEAAAVPHLKMGGTASAAFMIDKWKSEYRKEKGIALDYDSTGSTKGIGHVIDKDYAVGFTHAPVAEKQRKEARAKGGDVVHIPVFFCAVVPVYQLKDLPAEKPPLNFTGEVLADIFLGKIEKWNDPSLKKLNEGVKLPDTPIAVVHREDSSGTTFIFTDYLHGASAAWAQQMGEPRSEVKWPVGVGAQRNVGVAADVAQTEGAIGYVDLVYAYAGKLSYGAVQNKDRTAFIHAEPENMTAAAQGLGEIPDDLTFGLTNKPGKDAYPICGAVWAVCYQSQAADHQKMVADFLRWVSHEGQQFARERTYAPLSEDLVKRVDQKLTSLSATP